MAAPSLDQAIERARRVLLHERARGYDDHAVIGGLEGFVAAFTQSLLPLVPREKAEDLSRLRTLVRGYAQQSPTERARAVQRCIATLTMLAVTRDGGWRARDEQQEVGSAPSCPGGPGTPGSASIPARAPGHQPSLQGLSPQTAAPPQSPTTTPCRGISALAAGTAPSSEKARARGSARALGKVSPTEKGRAIVEPRAPGSAPPTEKARAIVEPRATRGTTGAPAKTTATPDTHHSPLDQPLEQMRGLRADELKKAARLGLATPQDVLYYLPFRYYPITPIRQLKLGQDARIVGQVVYVRTDRSRRGFQLSRVALKDESGVIEVTFINQPYIERVLHQGARAFICGKLALGRLGVGFNPDEFDALPPGDEVEPLWPVYHKSAGISDKWVRRFVRRFLDQWLPRVEDWLPDSVRKGAGLLGLREALRQAHLPANEAARQRAAQRLAFDELFVIQLGVLRKKHDWQHEAGGIAMTEAPRLAQAFTATLPFSLTGAQCRAIDDIVADMARPIPMSRLLQGDVGSGKTAVAAAALAAACASGYRGAIMAPTEILAEQHERTLRALLASGRSGRADGAAEGDGRGGARPSSPRPAAQLSLLGEPEAPEEEGGLRVCLLKGSQTARQKQRLKASIAAGEVDVVVGTHALLQEGVEIPDLGLVVIDEQHRFGVNQRAMLRQKGHNPHLLVMTATPIPRTLALTLWGDLDLTVIDEMPPGRQRIKTSWVPPEGRPGAYGFIREQVHCGRQVFVICPLVEESEKLEVRAATAEYERLRREVFPDLRLGLLHGRLKPREKEAVMESFRSGEIQVLISTAVVEVGVDVPNATVMVIEAAERFGLAQLHQFRGRVGRGADASHCLLLSDTSDPGENARLQALINNADGFALAEEDLKLRGPGEFLGTRQSGLPDLKVAKLSDVATIDVARRQAQRLFALDPLLQRPEHRALARQVQRFWETGLPSGAQPATLN